ncbi:MAG: hypothetical protein HYZ95_03705 [Candidatus Omnitrophica bacterium]|nr:hypothetical protein [Candidatus Omnitrophota bacterium]
MASILRIAWKTAEASPVRELGHPGPDGKFRVLRGRVYTARFGGKAYRFHLCLDEYRRLCVIAGEKHSAVLELAKRFLSANGHTAVDHNGAMTVRVPIRRALVIRFVQQRCPELVVKGKVELGSLQRRITSWQQLPLHDLVRQEPEFLRRTLAYSLLRQTLKDKIRPTGDAEIVRLPRRSPASQAKYGPRGESQAHRELKEYLAKRPWKLGLSSAFKGKTEYNFLTGDRADIGFVKGGRPRAVVEVEILASGTEVGMYQAIKYRCLAAAIRFGGLNPKGIKAFLVAPEIPLEIQRTCKAFEVKAQEVQVPALRSSFSRPKK